MKKNIFFLALVCLFSLSSTSYAQDIFASARTNDVASVKQFIKDGIKVDTANGRGFTPLILAVYNDSYEAAQLLIENGANINAQDMSGNTALMGAAFKKNLRMVELLIAKKAAVNQRNLNDASALIFAATFGQKEIVATLLANGADKSIKDKSGKTAFDHATFQENEAIAALLK